MFKIQLLYTLIIVLCPFCIGVIFKKNYKTPSPFLIMADTIYRQTFTFFCCLFCLKMRNWDISKKSRIMADFGHMRAGKRSDNSYFDFKASGWEFVTSFSFCKKS